MERRCRGVVALALCIGGVAACAATPAPPGPSVVPGATTIAETPSEAPTASPTAAPGRSGLAAEIEVRSIDPSLTDPLLAFASDGVSLIFSSGVADGPDSESAPDLWRYVDGPAAKPHLVWSNPERDHSLVRIDGDIGVFAFADIPNDGSRAWDLWLVPEEGHDGIKLDSHPGDADVPSLVPSFDVYDNTIAWTAFDRGTDGPVSQLWMARAPDWSPHLVAERTAADRELWLPSLYPPWLAYTEVTYSPDRSSDERAVFLLDTTNLEAGPRRLDTSGLATMPLVTPSSSVVWKEADPGFNMFNWGKMHRYDMASGTVSALSVWPQEYVNYPSVGTRFIAWWGADAFKFGVYDLVRDQVRLIENYSEESGANVLRPHVAGDIMVWLYVEQRVDGEFAELRFAFLPNAGADR